MVIMPGILIALQTLLLLSAVQIQETYNFAFSLLYVLCMRINVIDKPNAEFL